MTYITNPISFNLRQILGTYWLMRHQVYVMISMPVTSDKKKVILVVH